MKTDLLQLTPKQFCAATGPCSGGTELALKHKTMKAVWDECQRGPWLIWILKAIDAPVDEKACRLYMVWCARNTPLVDGRTTGALLTEPENKQALVVAESFANGAATQEALSAARSTAIRCAARSTAWSIPWCAARTAEWTTAEFATWSAAGFTTWFATEFATEFAGQPTARSAARSAAESAQAIEIKRIVKNPFA